ncbi:hypothetical protein SHELI_v1c03300 [Spiroplasma helicoides]|uniref:Uncharacterized protein n=1 Tax=Spiroplasma helicoides TaxID=216938 RepID=A0A1B3SK37_9MOLU|nr:hypothetical protein [Spiroplasma helicoides]AOG60285.1 hypothetical protein SHELI_v1c03300 [Spiroplasma helicoides]
MAKDFNTNISFTKGNEIEKIIKALDEGKTIIWAVEYGEKVRDSLAKGKIEFLGNANCELKELKEDCGTCGCGKPANALIYVWR